MTLFALYRSIDNPAGLPMVVAEKFSWFATLLPPVHALVHRLWDQLALFLVGLALVVVSTRVIGFDAAIWLYILLALACGFAAPGAMRRALRRRGYSAAGHRFAEDADLARVAALEARP